uniref:Uncharacterized protein n=1 Tax=Anguilla anguilla TaxID=7936 RepID=A0A0E9WFZ2_ANGAN
MERNKHNAGQGRGHVVYSPTPGRKGKQRAETVGNVGLGYAVVRLEYERANDCGLSVRTAYAPCIYRNVKALR